MICFLGCSSGKTKVRQSSEGVKLMSKQEFSDREQENNSTRRGGQNHGSFGGKDSERRDGEELGKKGAHSNTGVGDEKNPILEDESQ